jgi:hypothetical protein
MRRGRPGTRRDPGQVPESRMRTIAVILLAVVTASACRGERGQPAVPEAPVLLDVRNHSGFEVNIFALPSSVSQTRIRIGTIVSFTDAQFRVPKSGLRTNGTLVLLLHAIGSTYWWESPSVSVYEGVRPCLDIHATLEGSLRLSQFYTRLVEGEDSTETACGMHTASNEQAAAASRQDSVRLTR